MEEIVIREFRTEDIPFITNSWLTSFRDQSFFTRDIPKHIYFKCHGELASRILQRHTSLTLVAASKEDSDIIIGYLVTEKTRGYDIVHYVYVKRAFNGLGICKLLFGAAGEFEYASHLTRSGKSLIEKLDLKYCPYLLFYA